MALVTLNPMFINYRGRMGKLVHYNRLGTDCVRRHVVPRNPNTAAQRTVRAGFREAVHAWQALPVEERSDWNRKGRYRNMTGYNLFLSRYMKRSCQALPGRSSGVPLAFSSDPATNAQRFHSVAQSFQVKNGSCECSITPGGCGKG